MLPAVLLAIAAAGALAIWGDPVGADLDSDLAGIDLGTTDKSLEAITLNREGLPIDINIDPATFQLMRRMENRVVYKDRAVNADLRFGDSGEVRRYGVLTLRGRGSLLKSSALPNYDVKMIRPVPFADGVEMQRLFLMNLYYDRHQMEIPVAYRLLAEMGLFPLHFQFVRLTVAGQAHGMYLLVEPPVSGLRRTHSDCVSVFRRSRPNGYDVEWTASVPGSRSSLNQLKAAAQGDTGTPLSTSLPRSIDEQRYFSWLAVNALLRNADSLDELFLYERRPEGSSPKPLQVLAWDYDDILNSELKPGAISNPLLYGCLDPLEHRVAESPELMARYKRYLAELLKDELSLERVEKIVVETQALRDGLDDGSGEVEQRRARKKRAAFVEEMLGIIRSTHSELTRLATTPASELR
ncbi:MAG: CotH kinase family protein [Verrucomicrobiales bacterium]